MPPLEANARCTLASFGYRCRSRVVPKRARSKPDGGKSAPAEPVGLLGFVAAVHNLILSGGSLVMLLGCASEVLRRAQHEESYEFVLCENPLTEAQGPLFFWSYVPTVPRRPEARVVPSCCLELLLSGSPFHLSTSAAVEWMYRAFPWLGEAGMACFEAA